MDADKNASRKTAHQNVENWTGLMGLYFALSEWHRLPQVEKLDPAQQAAPERREEYSLQQAQWMQGKLIERIAASQAFHLLRATARASAVTGQKWPWLPNALPAFPAGEGNPTEQPFGRRTAHPHQQAVTEGTPCHPGSSDVLSRGFKVQL